MLYAWSDGSLRFFWPDDPVDDDKEGVLDGMQSDIQSLEETTEIFNDLLLSIIDGEMGIENS